MVENARLTKEQIEAVLLQRANDHVSELFDKVVQAVPGGQAAIAAALSDFKSGVETIGAAVVLAAHAAAEARPENVVPCEPDGPFRIRILNAGARGSVNEKRVEKAIGEELDAMGRAYGIARRGTKDG